MRTRGTLRRPGSIRNALVAATSGLVLLSSGAYVMAPNTLALAAQVSPDHKAVPDRGLELLYGKVTGLRGHGIAGVHIAVTGGDADDTDHGTVVLVSNSDGTFRRLVHLDPGQYTLTVTQQVGDHHIRRVTKQFRLQSGRAYRIDVEVKRHGLFAFLPLGSY